MIWTNKISQEDFLKSHLKIKAVKYQNYSRIAYDKFDDTDEENKHK